MIRSLMIIFLIAPVFLVPALLLACLWRLASRRLHPVASLPQ